MCIQFLLFCQPQDNYSFKTIAASNLSFHTRTAWRSQKSKVIYKASCWDCNDFYIGKTRRRLHDGKTEHFKALVKNDHKSAIADHVKTTGHNIKWDHFDILASGKTDYHCKIKETLLIQELKPAFNVNVLSEKLMLISRSFLYRFTVKIVFLISVPDPLSLLYKRFVKNCNGHF